MRKKSQVKKNKSQDTAKANEPKQHQVHTLNMYYIDFYFIASLFQKRRWFYFRTFTFPWAVTGTNFISFIILTFCSKGHILIQVPHANFFTVLNNICTIFPLKSISRKLETAITHLLAHFWCTFDALLMHFSILLHLTNFAKIDQWTPVTFVAVLLLGFCDSPDFPSRGLAASLETSEGLAASFKASGGLAASLETPGVSQPPSKLLGVLQAPLKLLVAHFRLASKTTDRLGGQKTLSPKPELS